MGRVLPFSQASDFVRTITAKGRSARAILDTNILIASTYEISKDHEIVSPLLVSLAKLGVEFYATVNTRSEFMEFHRRLVLTEVLLDLIDEHSKTKIPNAARSEIKTAYASVKSKQARDGIDPIFNDTQLKKIKSEFSAGCHSDHLGWLKLCELYLKDYITGIDENLSERGVQYLSPNDPKRAHLFTQTLDWPIAAAIVEKTGLSISDSMIMNALNSSVCDFSISLDFDFGFATLADKESKDVLMPDSDARLIRKFKNLASAIQV